MGPCGWSFTVRRKPMEELDERIENLKESQEELNGPLPEESFRYLVPIGEWGAGWGPLCLDLSRPEEQVDLEDDSTWSLVWFDHEEFDWGAKYLGGGRPAPWSRGRPGFPNAAGVVFLLPGGGGI